MQDQPDHARDLEMLTHLEHIGWIVTTVPATKPGAKSDTFGKVFIFVSGGYPGKGSGNFPRAEPGLRRQLVQQPVQRLLRGAGPLLGGR